MGFDWLEWEWGEGKVGNGIGMERMKRMKEESVEGEMIWERVRVGIF